MEKATLNLEVKGTMPDYDFIEVGFRVQAKSFGSSRLARFAQGEFRFRFPEKSFLLRASGGTAELVVDPQGAPVSGRLDLKIRDASVWIRIAQRKLHPLKALLKGEIEIVGGGMRGLLLYGRCFARPHCAKVESFERLMRQTPPLERIERVLVLNASPRRFGATQQYLQQLVAGLSEGGGAVEVVSLYEKEINACRGCFACWMKTPGTCIFRDDMDWIIPQIESCDLLVLVFPTYVANITSGLQRLLERCFPIVHAHGIHAPDGVVRHPRRNRAHRQFMVGLNVYGFYEPEQSRHHTAHLTDVAGHFCFDFLGLIRVSNCIAKAINRQDDEVLQKDLSLLRVLGRKLVAERTLDRRLVGRLNVGSPFSWEETLHFNNNFLELVQEENAAGSHGSQGPVPAGGTA